MTNRVTSSSDAEQRDERTAARARSGAPPRCGSAATVSQKGLGRIGCMGMIGLGADFTLGCAPHPVVCPMDLAAGARVQPLCGPPARRAARACGAICSHASMRRSHWAAMRGRCSPRQGDAAALARALRRLRARVVLRTLLRDLTGRADLTEVCATMTQLAEMAIGAAVDLHHRRLVAGARRAHRRGQRRPRSAWSSSAWASSAAASSTSRRTSIWCSSIPKRARPPDPRSLANQEFFDRLGRRVIAALADVTADGFVFRVDMRLRPYGDSGPLASSFAALEQYLVTQGRTWERYAWLKARALTGDRSAELEQLIIPFVFRKYLDYDAYNGLRDVHRQIREQGRRKDHARNIKLGPGGIREIEFIVQALQLVRGGKEPALRAARHAAGARRAGRARAAAAPGDRRARPPPTSSCAISSTGCSTGTTSRCTTVPTDARRAARCWRAPVGFADAAALAGGARCVTATRSSGTSRRCSARTSAASDDPLAAVWLDPAPEDAQCAALAAAGLRRAARAHRDARPRARRPALPAAADAVAPAFRRAGAAAAARRGDGGAARDADAGGRVRPPARVARNDQRTQRLPGAARRASAGAAAARAADGGQRVGGGLSHPAPAAARRIARQPRRCSPSPTGRVVARARARAARACRRCRAADGRAAPFPAGADVSPAGAGPQRPAQRRAPCRPPVGAGRHRARRHARALLGADARPGTRGAAALRDRRLRQARRQGARATRPTSTWCSCTTIRDERRAGALCAARPPPEHLAYRHHRGRPLCTTPTCACDPTAPAGWWYRAWPRSAATSASRRGPGSTRRCRGRASSPATRRSVRLSSATARRSCACRAIALATGRGRHRHAPPHARRPSQPQRAVRPQARSGRHGRCRVHRAVPGAAAQRAPSGADAQQRQHRAARARRRARSYPGGACGTVADAYRAYRRAQHQIRLQGAPLARVDPAPQAARRAAIGELWRHVFGAPVAGRRPAPAGAADFG